MFSSVTKMDEDETHANEFEPRDFSMEFNMPNETPDMVVGSSNALKGDIKFERYLRVEGSIEGQIIAPPHAKIQVCEGGSYKGDVCGLSAALIDGRVVGDINVERLFLASHAEVHGDIVCKSIEIDCNAALVGRLQVSHHSVVQSNYEEDRSIIDGGLDSDDENSSEFSLKSEELPIQRRNYKVILLIMEPQVDFYGKPHYINSNSEVDPSHSLNPSSVSKDYSGNVIEEEGTLAQFISQHLDEIDEIVVTLNSYHKLHISHSTYWVDGSDAKIQPKINTLITAKDVEEGVWHPRKPELLDSTIDLMKHLNEQHAYYGYRCLFHNELSPEQLSDLPSGVVIRPEYCLIGSQGAAIVPGVHRAINEWVDHSMRDVTYLTIQNQNLLEHVKGHLLQEQESSAAVVEGKEDDRAQFQAILDPSKYFDLRFLELLNPDDKLLICGQAVSHCVGFSVHDVIAEALRSSRIKPENISILEDVTSASALTNPISSLIPMAEPLDIQRMKEDPATNDSDVAQTDTNTPIGLYMRLRFLPRLYHESNDSAELSSSEAVDQFWKAFESSPVTTVSTADITFTMP